MDDDSFVGDGKPVPYEQMTKEARNSIGNPIPKE